MSVALIGAFGLGEINVAANAAVLLTVPLLAEFDLVLMGGFGLGALQADIAAQLNASISAQVDLGLQISDPLAALRESLEAAIQIQASIAATIALGLPAIQVEISAELSASASISAALGLKLGGIQLLISAALAVKLPLANFVGELAASLSAGPVALLSFADPGDTLASAGFQLNSLFSAGIAGIAPGDQVYGVVLVTKAPSAWAAMQATLRTS